VDKAVDFVVLCSEFYQISTASHRARASEDNPI
jgi:hypothetical protein